MGSVRLRPAVLALIVGLCLTVTPARASGPDGGHKAGNREMAAAARGLPTAWAYWTMRASFRGPVSQSQTTRTFPATFTIRTSTSATSSQAAAAARKAAAGQGYSTAQATQTPVRSTGYRAFTNANYRFNLAVKTGVTKLQHHAHHIYPQKFRPDFGARGINIDNPKYLRWWWQPSHNKLAREYNARWARFFRDNQNATANDIHRFGARLQREYSRYYNPPGPRGCGPGVCRDTMAA